MAENGHDQNPKITKKVTKHIIERAMTIMIGLLAAAVTTEMNRVGPTRTGELYAILRHRPSVLFLVSFDTF